MPFLTLRDGAELFYQHCGPKDGKPVLLSHGWPLNSDNWEPQIFFLANKGYRVVAHDRRSHGRSTQTWEGNDLDTWADDLHELVENLDLRDMMMAGHSTGGHEIAKYAAKYG